MQRLTTVRWRAHPQDLRTSAPALYFSPAEYASPFREQSLHVMKMDIALHYRLHEAYKNRQHPFTFWFAPPLLRRRVQSMCESAKHSNNKSHPVFDRAAMIQRLKSRNCFPNSVKLATEAAHNIRESLWQQNYPDAICTSEFLPSATAYISEIGRR